MRAQERGQPHASLGSSRAHVLESQSLVPETEVESSFATLFNELLAGEEAKEVESVGGSDDHALEQTDGQTSELKTSRQVERKKGLTWRPPSESSLLGSHRRPWLLSPT